MAEAVYDRAMASRRRALARTGARSRMTGPTRATCPARRRAVFQATAPPRASRIERIAERIGAGDDEGARALGRARKLGGPARGPSRTGSSG